MAAQSSQAGPPGRRPTEARRQAPARPADRPPANRQTGAGAGAGTGSSPGAGPEPEPGAEPGADAGGNRWVHGAELARVTAIDLALLAGHLLMYPTGILPERLQSPTPTPASPAVGDATGDGQPAAAARLPADGRAHPPVLLLHGFVDNRSAFTVLRRSLLRNGWTCVQALNYSPLTCDIRTAAELLGPHIEQVCEQSGHRRVDIVGHSLGGLIARYYVQCLGGDAQVRTLVTLGTPHSGTRAIPALAPHPLARQMRPGSAVLKELASPAKGCGTRFAAFWSDLDQLMIPVASARLEHPDLVTRNIKVSGIGHLALPVHGAVAADIRRVLAGERPLTYAVDAA